MITLSDGLNSLELNDFLLFCQDLIYLKNTIRHKMNMCLKSLFKKKQKRLPENFSYNF